VQISELMSELAASATILRCTSILVLYSLGLNIIMFISNGTIQLNIFLLHTFIPVLEFNIQSSRYLNPHDYFQGIQYQFYRMQHSVAPYLPVQQLLWQVPFACYQSVWQPGWTRQHNQPNHADLCTLFKSPPHIVVIEHIRSFVECSCTA